MSLLKGHVPLSSLVASYPVMYVALACTVDVDGRRWQRRCVAGIWTLFKFSDHMTDVITELENAKSKFLPHYHHNASAIASHHSATCTTRHAATRANEDKTYEGVRKPSCPFPKKVRFCNCYINIDPHYLLQTSFPHSSCYVLWANFDTAGR